MAEKALVAGIEHLQEFMDELPQMAWTANANGRILYFNKAWYEFTGMRSGTTEGWIQMVHPEDSCQVIEAWNKSLQTGDYYIEYRIRNAEDSTYRWFLEQAMPIRDKAGHISIWFGTYTDITEEKQEQEP